MIKHSISLFFFLMTAVQLLSQSVERKLIYTVPLQEEIPDVLSNDHKSFFDPASPDFSNESLFSVKEPAGGFKVFYNGENLGTYSEAGKFNYSGDLLLELQSGNRTYLEVNGLRHGPFSKILHYDVRNGHLIVEHYDPVNQTNYLYEDSVNISSKKASSSLWGPSRMYDWIPVPHIWEEKDDISIYVKGNLICKNCHWTNFESAGNHYFFTYRYADQKDKLFYIVDDQKEVQIESYWSPRIDSFGNFYMPCLKNGKHYVQTRQELFGPIKDYTKNLHSKGAFGLLFKFQKPEGIKEMDYLYNNGQVYGPWDSIRLFTGSDIYYYEVNKQKFIGRNGQPIYEFTEKKVLKA